MRNCQQTANSQVSPSANRMKPAVTSACPNSGGGGDCGGAARGCTRGSACARCVAVRKGEHKGEHKRGGSLGVRASTRLERLVLC